MSIVQISAALGPAECELAVKYTLQEMQKEAKNQKIDLEIIESNETKYGYSSILLNVNDDAKNWLNNWLGTIQWTFQSKIRPNHKRKNWFVGVSLMEVPQQLPTDDSIIFQACRASGAGGQHVNTTDSAIHATHVASGISVKVMSERSQHANKRLAKELITLKLQQQFENNQASNKQVQHLQHALIERGNAVRNFKK
ncbi:peptide chain release factor H [Acinetobacter sp. WCHAc060025]|uniref:peptide chain release factor H n=1 Tax=Acinetobacter sp. WCHAc060025 TaxID=2518625 RepID=UPI001023A192|nr:peptide chain release factor H [Acinetobacter sp. WCHAc060025]RZG76337.1 peptide chain release factor H [Acinetobacter sp. WCHAc060025]